MNKSEFITMYSEIAEKTKKDSGIDIENFFTALKKGLKQDNKVAFTGDLAFEIIPTNERKGRNPSTGEDILIPAGKKVKVKVGKTFKSEVIG